MDPDEARQNPEEAVDALERRIQAGRRADGSDASQEAETPESGDDEDGVPPEPAFEVDLDPEDQGGAAAGASNPD